MNNLNNQPFLRNSLIQDNSSFNTGTNFENREKKRVRFSTSQNDQNINTSHSDIHITIRNDNLDGTSPNRDNSYQLFDNNLKNYNYSNQLGTRHSEHNLLSPIMSERNLMHQERRFRNTLSKKPSAIIETTKISSPAPINTQSQLFEFNTNIVEEPNEIKIIHEQPNEKTQYSPSMIKDSMRIWPTVRIENYLESCNFEEVHVDETWTDFIPALLGNDALWRRFEEIIRDSLNGKKYSELISIQKQNLYIQIKYPRNRFNQINKWKDELQVLLTRVLTENFEIKEVNTRFYRTYSQDQYVTAQAFVNKFYSILGNDYAAFFNVVNGKLYFYSKKRMSEYLKEKHKCEITVDISNNYGNFEMSALWQDLTNKFLEANARVSADLKNDIKFNGNKTQIVFNGTLFDVLYMSVVASALMLEFNKEVSIPIFFENTTRDVAMVKENMEKWPTVKLQNFNEAINFEEIHVDQTWSDFVPALLNNQALWQNFEKAISDYLKQIDDGNLVRFEKCQSYIRFKYPIFRLGTVLAFYRDDIKKMLQLVLTNNFEIVEVSPRFEVSLNDEYIVPLPDIMNEFNSKTGPNYPAYLNIVKGTLYIYSLLQRYNYLRTKLEIVVTVDIQNYFDYFNNNDDWVKLCMKFGQVNNSKPATDVSNELDVVDNETKLVIKGAFFDVLYMNIYARNLLRAFDLQNPRNLNLSPMTPSNMLNPNDDFYSREPKMAKEIFENIHVWPTLEQRDINTSFIYEDLCIDKTWSDFVPALIHNNELWKRFEEFMRRELKNVKDGHLFVFEKSSRNIKFRYPVIKTQKGVNSNRYVIKDLILGIFHKEFEIKEVTTRYYRTAYDCAIVPVDNFLRDLLKVDDVYYPCYFSAMNDKVHVCTLKGLRDYMMNRYRTNLSLNCAENKDLLKTSIPWNDLCHRFHEVNKKLRRDEAVNEIEEFEGGKRLTFFGGLFDVIFIHAYAVNLLKNLESEKHFKSESNSALEYSYPLKKSSRSHILLKKEISDENTSSEHFPVLVKDKLKTWPAIDCLKDKRGFNNYEAIHIDDTTTDFAPALLKNDDLWKHFSERVREALRVMPTGNLVTLDRYKKFIKCTYPKSLDNEILKNRLKEIFIKILSNEFEINKLTSTRYCDLSYDDNFVTIDEFVEAFPKDYSAFLKIIDNCIYFYSRKGSFYRYKHVHPADFKISCLYPHALKQSKAWNILNEKYFKVNNSIKHLTEATNKTKFGNNRVVVLGSFIDAIYMALYTRKILDQSIMKKFITTDLTKKPRKMRDIKDKLATYKVLIDNESDMDPNIFILFLPDRDKYPDVWKILKKICPNIKEI